MNTKHSPSLGIDIGTSHITFTYSKTTHTSPIPYHLSNFKPFIGRHYDNTDLHTIPLNYHFNYVRYNPILNKVVSDHDNIKDSDHLKLYTHNNLLDPIEPLVDLLIDIKEKVETELHAIIDKISISIPAKYNTTQKNSILLACHLAGFTETRLVYATTAVALTYICNNKIDTFKGQCMLIINMGSYFLDVSIYELNAVDEKNYITMIALDGACLGGSFFDEMLVNYCIKQMKDVGFRDVNEVEMLKLFDACEEARVMLSSNDSVEIRVGLIQDEKDYVLKVGKDEYDVMCEKLFKKVMDRVMGTLMLMRRMKPYYNDEGFYKMNTLDSQFMIAQKEEINSVILSGCFCKTPKIIKMISDFFGEDKVCLDLLQKETVSVGTEYHAKIHSGSLKEADNKIMFEEAIPYPVIMLSDSEKKTDIFRKNELYPTTRSISIETETAYQTETSFRIIEGASSDCSENSIISNCTFKGIPPAPKGTYSVPFIFVLDYNGLLNIFILNHKTREHDSFFKNNLYGKMTKDEVERIKKAVEARRMYRVKNAFKIEMENKVRRNMKMVERSEKDIETRKNDLKILISVKNDLRNSEVLSLKDVRSFKKRMRPVKRNHSNEHIETSSSSCSTEEDITGKNNAKFKVEKKELKNEKKMLKGSKKDMVFGKNKDKGDTNDEDRETHKKEIDEKVSEEIKNDVKNISNKNDEDNASKYIEQNKDNNEKSDNDKKSKSEADIEKVKDESEIDNSKSEAYVEKIKEEDKNEKDKKDITIKNKVEKSYIETKVETSNERLEIEIEKSKSEAYIEKNSPEKEIERTKSEADAKESEDESEVEKGNIKKEDIKIKMKDDKLEDDLEKVIKRKRHGETDDEKKSKPYLEKQEKNKKCF